MSFRSVLMGTVACALTAAPGLAQDTTALPPHHKHHTSALELRLQRMEAEIEELKAELARQQTSGGATAMGAAPQPQPQPQVSAAQFESLQNQVYETQAAVNQALKPKDNKIHLKGITVTLGGFVAAESVYRSRAEQADIGSTFIGIPFAGPASSTSAENGRMSEWRMTARQSRISALVQGSPDADTLLSAYGEFDFLGAAASANSNESNSYQPRIRALYGTADWNDLGLEFLFGQNWSLVTLTSSGMSPRTELAPPTIDAQYVVGFDWTRQPQLRLVKDFDDQVWAGISLENPQTVFGGTAPTGLAFLNYNTGTGFNGGTGSASSEFNPGITLSFNHVPDIIGKIAIEPAAFGGNVHVELFGIYRDFYDRSGVTLATASNHDTSGGGIGANALIKLLPGFLDLQADTIFGSGIGRYGSGQLPDVTWKANGEPTPLTENIEMFGLTLHATPDLDIYTFGGHEQELSGYGKENAVGAADDFGYGNPFYDNTGCFAFAASGKCTGNTRALWQITPGLWWNAYAGDFGRLRIGLQYSYTEREAFPGLEVTPTNPTGVGGRGPTAIDHMVFTSFRYYPF
jgi:hypothetical protein